MNHFQAFKVAPVALAISAALSLSACSPEGNDNPIVSSDEVIINNEASANTSNVQIFITLPQRVQTLSADMEVILTIGDQNSCPSV